MRQSLVHFVLALSLLFNGFFVIGYLQGRESAASIPTEERVTQLVADELRLTPNQQQVYRELRANLHHAVNDLDSQLARVQLALIEAVNQPKPDFVEILRLMDEKTQLDQARVGVASRHFSEFARTLSPSQKAALKRRIEERGWRSERSLPASTNVVDGESSEVSEAKDEPLDDDLMDGADQDETLDDLSSVRGNSRFDGERRFRASGALENLERV